jgi:hypothetical protein
MTVHPLKTAQDSDDEELVLSPMDRRITPRRVTPQRLAVGGLILVAWAAVGSQAYRAARIRPAEVLRYE